MLHFMFVDGFMSKQEFTFVVHYLSANELSQLITNISDNDLSKYVFEDKNNEMLSHYKDKELIKLLRRHYSDTFAVFVLNQFKPQFLKCSLSKRMKYLKIISVDMLMRIYQWNNIGKQLDINELEYLFTTLQMYVKSHHKENTKKYLEILSCIVQQIVTINAVFLTLDANNFHFTFYNQLIEIEDIINKLTADELTKSIQNINDKNIENHIFLEKPMECLSHFKEKDLNELLTAHYSDSLVMFVFHQFTPSFLTADLLQRSTYLNVVSIDIMIWLYSLSFDDNTCIGKCLTGDDLIIYFKTLKKYITTHGNYKENNGKYWNILSSVTQLLIEENTHFITGQETLQFVFVYGLVTIKKVKEIQIIIHELKVDELSLLLQTLNDKKLQHLIFKRQPKEMLSHYNTNDLMQLLKQYYSDSFAIFVFEQFTPHFLQSKSSYRKRFATIVSVDILIW
eukprot:478408_1